jgi:hypothetical protein
MQNLNIKQASSEYIVTRDEIRSEDLLMLASGQIGAIVIKNFYDTSFCQDATGYIKKNIQYYLNAPSIGRLGMAYYETERQKNLIDEYYNHAISNIQKIRQIFYPYMSPIDLLRLSLQEKWTPGAVLENIDGRKMFIGLCRIVEPTIDFLPHQDKLCKDAPNSLKARSLLAQFAANVYLDVPENGGELDMWEEEFDDETYDRMRKDGSYGIERNLLPPPHHTIKPTSGDLIIFNARRLHAVKPAINHSRISIACFIGYYGQNKPLTYWS